MRILRAIDRTATPWKNGGGITREVAASPPGAPLESFDWRVSLADVSAGGPFSFFARIDRCLAVLQGRVSLTIGTHSPVELSPASPPLRFPGDVPVSAELLGGPVIDLNVMTRRNRFESRVERNAARGTQRLPLQAAATLILALEEVTVAAGGADCRLAKFDAALFESGGNPQRLVTVGGGEFFFVELVRTA